MPAAAAAYISTRVLMFDLDKHIAAELERVLPECSCDTSHQLVDDIEGCRIRLAAASADVIFCPADYPFLCHLLITARSLSVPVVVVTQFPDTREWLDAMDAGASDYAVPPFEEKQLSWILSGVRS